MAIQSRVTLKSLFENGDTPEGGNYADWIDSYLHLTDGSAQSVDSPVTFNNAVKVATLSAAAIVLSGPLTLTTVISTKVETDVLVASAATISSAAITQLTASSAIASSISINAVNFLAETTAEASSGPGGALPASAAGFIEVQVSGSAFVVPYFRREA